ncbi:MAG: N-acetyl sugar amidotransferase [Bdellovibrionaceae bacterium]|nr:N-acetyl sugar amidotransferase [Bdellovibrionales bacterium]MCB9083094.1 N-acetyl sugar amidotransferase [Pseudobdellovibrionaceae bacterium]
MVESNSPSESYAFPTYKEGEKQIVIVSGVPTELVYQRCSRCIQDSTIPGISFNDQGVCNFCHLHDKMAHDFPNDERGAKLLEEKLEKIRVQGKGKKYDCVVGISGGRDSMFLLYLAAKRWGLRPLAVHFNDGFDNPVGGENMFKAVRRLGVDLRTITSDFRECKDLKIAELKASTPLLNTGTDVGIGASIYSVACKEGVKNILFGQSFRTEGIKPISWAYFNGDYLKAVQKKFGSGTMRPWKPDDAGYHLGFKEMAYYTVVKGIKVLAPLYYFPYVRKEAEEILKSEFDWVYPGGHYYDDLYWALIVHVHRVKFNVDLRLNSYSALVRSGQMDRDEALKAVKEKYVIEDPNIIRLCIKRLGITREDFDEYMKIPATHFTDHSNCYAKLKAFKVPIQIMTWLNFFPQAVYDKYFNCGI